MTLLKPHTNKTLKGHKAVIFTTVPAPKSQIDAIRNRFPDLKIVTRVQPWGAPVGDDWSDDEWKDTTVLLTSTILPTKEQAPHAPVCRDECAVFDCQWSSRVDLGVDHHYLFDLSTQVTTGSFRRRPSGGGFTPTLKTPKTLPARQCILGYGSIGRQTARLAKALGMNVHAYTLHPRPTPESRRDDSYSPEGLGDPEGVFPRKWFSGSSKEEIHEFLGSGLDLLVIATPLTEKTRNLIAKPEFEVLRNKRTFVSNIARGPIVNTDDLIEALNGDVIQGAAIDVTDPEPLPDGHPLWSAKNITITPHISAASASYYYRVLDIFRLNLERLSQGRDDFVNKVNRKEGY
ncbi:hypothetical protein ACJ41O_014575 [Fusarium nematophilum]